MRYWTVHGFEQFVVLAGLPDAGRVVFLVAAVLTHAAVGYTLVVMLTEADPRVGIFFGVLPDVDFLFPEPLGFPFVHRGLAHTPAVALLVVSVVLVVTRREIAIATGIALFSHLGIDGLSPEGIMWLYPVTLSPSPGLPVHSAPGTAVLWVGVVGVFFLISRNDSEGAT